MLSEVELQQMCDEMASKFSRLSDELLTSLQLRDVMAGEMEAKNRCTVTAVTAILAVCILLTVFTVRIPTHSNHFVLGGIVC